MTENTNASLFRCPTCKNQVARESHDFPFCGERCRITDLGRWASGDYRIAGEPAPLTDEPDGYG